MSEAIGPVAVLSQDGQGPLLPGVSETSEHTQELIDEETQRIVADAHAEVTRLLGEHRDQLESLAQALLAAETLDAPEAYAAAGVPLPPRVEDEPAAGARSGLSAPAARLPRARAARRRPCRPRG